MVLKRCIYGVDKNPLTVELAKVSLWLHSFTVGAPLSFLDHHLRCGDSLLGLRVSEGVKDLELLGGGLFARSAIAGAEAATKAMGRIEEISDSDVSEVRQSATLFDEVENTTQDLRGLLDFLFGRRWVIARMKKRERNDSDTPLVMTLAQHQKRAYKVLARGPDQLREAKSASETATFARFSELWHEVRTIADRERFLHWEVAFPGVWHNWQNTRPQGGFDAVIGNPPWDRIKLQEVEWFATRAPEIALAQTAAARRKGVQELRDCGSPLVEEFDSARKRSEGLSRMVRAYGEYPLLGGGDINLYSLFVERAMNLIKPDGFVGLLTPSGICADKTAASFFKFVSTSGRVSSLFDFENRRPGMPHFFPDVDSRQKFCALILGGDELQFEQTNCAFFLHETNSIQAEDRCFPLTPADFARVNPNTGTAPVFRCRRDAEITRGIYERYPVLVDRSGGEEKRAWPVKYVRMYDMTNDSHLFRTVAQLDADGFYRTAGNRYKRGEEECLPLYEGKMVQAFDHRAASVVINPQNLHRPAQPRDATPEERANREWLPDPQFWVSMDTIGWPEGLNWAVSFKDVTSPTNERTMIAAVVPLSGFGNTLPLLMPEGADIDTYHENAWLLVSCLNSLVFDYIARQKVQGQHLNLYIVEQIPVLESEKYSRRFGDKTARDIIKDHVLRLTYTAHDMRTVRP